MPTFEVNTRFRLVYRAGAPIRLRNREWEVLSVLRASKPHPVRLIEPHERGGLYAHVKAINAKLGLEPGREIPPEDDPQSYRFRPTWPEVSLDEDKAIARIERRHIAYDTARCKVALGLAGAEEEPILGYDTWRSLGEAYADALIPRYRHAKHCYELHWEDIVKQSHFVKSGPEQLKEQAECLNRLVAVCELLGDLRTARKFTNQERAIRKEILIQPEKAKQYFSDSDFFGTYIDESADLAELGQRTRSDAVLRRMLRDRLNPQILVRKHVDTKDPKKKLPNFSDEELSRFREEAQRSPELPDVWAESLIGEALNAHLEGCSSHALTLYRGVRKFSKAHGLRREQISALIHEAETLTDLERYDAAIELVKLALTLCDKGFGKQRLQARNALDLAKVLRVDRGQLLSDIKETTRLAELSGYASAIGHSYNNQALYFEQIGNLEAALDAYNKSEAMAKDLPHQIAIIARNKAYLLREHGFEERALEEARRAYVGFKKGKDREAEMLKKEFNL
jgi:tetratricopeptide (TPR) repeat protein